jgi:hypothetical protein
MKPTFAPNAALPMKPKKAQRKRDIVALLANLKRVGIQAWTIFQENVLIAVLLFLSIGTARQKRVVENVLQKSLPETVYDLTVEEAHCFYVDGVLVSNCHEALQYAVSGTGELNTMKARHRKDYKTHTYETNW